MSHAHWNRANASISNQINHLNAHNIYIYIIKYILLAIIFYFVILYIAEIDFTVKFKCKVRILKDDFIRETWRNG